VINWPGSSVHLSPVSTSAVSFKYDRVGYTQTKRNTHVVIQGRANLHQLRICRRSLEAPVSPGARVWRSSRSNRKWSGWAAHEIRDLFERLNLRLADQDQPVPVFQNYRFRDSRTIRPDSGEAESFLRCSNHGSAYRVAESLSSYGLVSFSWSPRLLLDTIVSHCSRQQYDHRTLRAGGFPALETCGNQDVVGAVRGGQRVAALARDRYLVQRHLAKATPRTTA
jgi:hypothetical protein